MRFSSIIALFLFACNAVFGPVLPLALANESGLKATVGKSLSVTAPKQSLARISINYRELKGWDYLFSLLVNKGMEPKELLAMFRDSRMPPWEPVYFQLKPGESKALYSRHNSYVARKNALEFYQEHREYFQKAHERYHIPESIVLSILQIETKCGAYTGQSRIFYRLARLASAASPENVEINYKHLKKRDAAVTREQVLSRAKWLEDTFFPHVVATLRVARSMKVHALTLRGSMAGAVGIPQFLPGNIGRYGVDADRDGRIDLFSAPDAILSAANYLSRHSKKQLSRDIHPIRQAIWYYNRSEAYVSTVLVMAEALEREISGTAMIHDTTHDRSGS